METRFENTPSADRALDPVRDPLRGRTLWVLVAMAFLAGLATVPYIAALTAGIPGRGGIADLGWARVVLVTALESLIVTLPIAWLGLTLLPKTGLPGAPHVRALFAREPVSRRSIATGFAQGLAIGMAVTLLVIGLDAAGIEVKPIVEIQSPAWWQGLLASFGAGVREEIWFRLGVMTVALRGLAAIAKRESPPAWAFWTANAVAALLFGAIHIPQAIFFVKVTPAVVAMVVGGNAVAGLGFGWIYRRGGIEAAMAAHMATDIVLHVVVPAVPGQ